jgi:uncharacterized protein
MTKESLIPYDDIVQEALRSVVGRVLSQVAKTKLPGAHHFYVAFRTGHPGVVIPQHLRERYPEEMTIVIQHRFWDLKVHSDRFEIGLSFSQRPEYLCIPFAAIVQFVDPSVNFALQFQVADNDQGPLSPEPPVEDESGPVVSKPPATGNVITLDRFRKKT